MLDQCATSQSAEIENVVLGFVISTVEELVIFMPQKVGTTFPNPSVFKLFQSHVEYVDVSTFKEMSKLKSLHLLSNKIKTIDDKSFEPPTALTQLKLAVDLFTTINKKHFDTLINLEEISF